MKHALTVLTVLLVAPLASLTQAKLEVAEATKAAKRAWESGPAEKRALWEQQRETAPERGPACRVSCVEKRAASAVASSSNEDFAA